MRVARVDGDPHARTLPRGRVRDIHSMTSRSHTLAAVSAPTIAGVWRSSTISCWMCAERSACFLALCDLYPTADVFTAVYDEDGTEGRFAHRNVHTSFLQRLRPTAASFRGLLPFYPYAIEALDLRGYDLVVSSSSAWAHGVIPDDFATHVSYCHNPFRYAWERARGHAVQPRPAGARRARRDLPALAPVGLDRRPARRHLRRQPSRRRAAASAATSTATRRWSTRRSRRAASPRARSATPTSSSAS